MFVKFMRKEGAPIWIKAESVVTVEPARTGGSLVVPMGDGLDYEVVEEPEVVLALLAGETPPAPKKTKRVATKKTKVAEEPVAEAPAATTEEPSVEAKPKKATKRATTKKKTAAKADAKAPAQEPVAAPEPPPVFFPAEQLERIRKMAPGSVRKLANTLNKQFNVSDPESVIKHLEQTGVIAVVEHGHVNWQPTTIPLPAVGK